MVRHCVCFKLKDRSKESISALKELLMSMKGKVPSLEELEVGADFLRSDRSYDVILISTHKSKEQLDEYQNDPYHMEIKKHIAEIRDASVAVDWEI